ncbi:hypothetical protein APHAL10511_000194 [Amanita phalloides]|nr:hypothetical protein APHAL10511_000194 [Amanita phalloides]
MASQRGMTLYSLIDTFMEALKLRRQYRQLPDSDDRVTEEQVSALESAPSRPRRKCPSCCICCYRNRSLICKAVGIPILILIGFAIFKIIVWANSDPPTGLENMPQFGTSLGCAALSHSTASTMKIPFDKDSSEHMFDAYGDILGTFTLVATTQDETEVRYELTISSNDPALLNTVTFREPEMSADGALQSSQFVLISPGAPANSDACLRYDIKLFVPPSLKKLHIASHTTMHLKIDPESHFHLDMFYATLYALSTNNLILPHHTLHANTLGLEVYRGWIVGDASIGETTSITTQRGDGVANVKVHPSPPKTRDAPEKAVLWTVTGAGRSAFTWIADGSALKRPIEADHKSSKNGVIYLTYRNANFNGLLALNARSYLTKNVYTIENANKTDKWNHWAGDRSGSDRLTLQSRGWTSLYF